MRLLLLGVFLISACAPDNRAPIDRVEAPIVACSAVGTDPTCKLPPGKCVDTTLVYFTNGVCDGMTCTWTKKSFFCTLGCEEHDGWGACKFRTSTPSTPLPGDYNPYPPH